MVVNATWLSVGRHPLVDIRIAQFLSMNYSVCKVALWYLKRELKLVHIEEIAFGDPIFMASVKSQHWIPVLLVSK